MKTWIFSGQDVCITTAIFTVLCFERENAIASSINLFVFFFLHFFSFREFVGKAGRKEKGGKLSC